MREWVSYLKKALYALAAFVVTTVLAAIGVETIEADNIEWWFTVIQGIVVAAAVYFPKNGAHPKALESQRNFKGLDIGEETVD